MRMGIFTGGIGDRDGIDGVVEMAATAAEQGFDSVWSEQIFGLDALTTLAVVGREVPRIELGTGVVPTYPRHPMMLAAQALTVQAATGNRLALGIGLSHQIVIESMLGLSFEKPLRHMREYLSVLLPLIRDGAVDFTGETIATHATVTVPGAEPCPVLVAALGPKMLELAGTVADGTITWMTGAATIAQHTVPTLRAAATAAGRPDPRTVVCLPVCVTGDVDGARERAARVFAVYGSLPSYRAMMDREGVAGPADLAISGDEKAVSAAIRRVQDAGATDFVAAEFASGDEERTRTRDLLRSLL